MAVNATIQEITGAVARQLYVEDLGGRSSVHVSTENGSAILFFADLAGAQAVADAINEAVAPRAVLEAAE
jgi:hypothetical protein